MATYNSKDGRVYMSGTLAGAAIAMTGAASWTLDQSASKDDATAFGDLNLTVTQGKPNMAGELSVIWDNTVDDLYDNSRSVGGVRMYLYPTSLDLTKYFYGLAYVDFKTECSGGTVKCSGSFAASDDWGQY